jgi:hypothetical protein
MRASEFMLQLAKRLMEERNIAESTSTQYLQTLYKLAGSKPFNNLSWTRKFEDVQAIIDTYATSTQGNQYMVLSSALSLFADKATYKGAYNHWKGKMLEAKAARDGQPEHQKSDKQDEAWLSWEDISKKKSDLQKDLSSFILTKHISPAQYERLLHYVILSLYTDIAPRRNQDFLDMFVVKKWTPDMPADKNYYDLATQKFIFNKYKTAKAYGQQLVDVPNTDEAPLQRTLAAYLKHHPLAKGKTKEFKLLVKQDGSNLNSVNAITRALNRIFGRKVGSSMLRHIYLTSKYGDTLKEMEKDSEDMGHSTDQQRDYIKYE